MPFLKLGEKDRERLGAPELLPFDLGGVTNREAIQLRTMFGFRTPKLWRLALRGQPVDVDGNDVTDPDAKTTADGGPIVDYATDAQAWTALLWMALKRYGIDTDPKALEFDVDAMDYVMEPEPEPDAESGKAEEPAEPPAPSET